MKLGLTTSPMPVKLPAVACIIIFPFLSPNISANQPLYLTERVIEHGLTSELVYPLCGFVACCVAESREEGDETGAEWSESVLAEDDGGEGRGG